MGNPHLNISLGSQKSGNSNRLRKIRETGTCIASWLEHTSSHCWSSIVAYFAEHLRSPDGLKRQGIKITMVWQSIL